MSTFENYSTYEVKKDPVVTPEIKKETAEQLKKAEEAKKVTRLAEEAKKAEEAKLADTILDNETKGMPGAPKTPEQLAAIAAKEKELADIKLKSIEIQKKIDGNNSSQNVEKIGSMSRLQNALDEQFPNKLSGQKVDEFLSSVTTDTLQKILTLNLDDSVAIDGMMKNEEFWNVVNNGLMKSSEIDQNTSNFIKTTIDRAKTDKELFKIILKSFKIYANEDLRQRNNINGTLDLNNLDTPASQKAILSLFSRDKLLYDTLIKQLGLTTNPTLKLQGENIVRKYLSLQFPDRQFTEKSVIAVVNTEQGSLIKVIEGDKEIKLGFGNNGEVQKFSDVVNFQSSIDIKKLYKLDEKGNIDMDRTEFKKEMEKFIAAGQQGLDQTSSNNNGKSIGKGMRGFMDQINAFMDSDLMSGFKQLGYMFASLFGSKEERGAYAIESAFSDAEAKLSRGTKNDIIKDENGNDITYLKGLKKIIAYPLEKDKDTIIDFKKRFVNAPIENQKKYIKAVFEESKDKFNEDTLLILGEKINKSVGSNETPQTDMTASRKIDSVGETSKDIFMVKGIDDKNSPNGVKIKMKGEEGSQYIVYNNSIIPLIKNNAKIYVLNPDGKTFNQKIISFSKNESGTIESKVLEGKKSLNQQLDFSKIIDNDTFDLWKNKKISQLNIGSLVGEERRGELEQKIIYDFSKMNTLNQTEENLKKSLSEIKKSLLPLLSVDKQVSLNVLDTITTS